MRFPLRISAPWKPVLAVLGMSPARSFAELDPLKGTLRVTAGVWFEETFPVAAIVGAEPSTWPWWGGLGVKLGPTGDTVSVVGSTEGVVAICFDEPQTMHVLVPVHRRELRLSLEEPEAFLAALNEARAVR